MKNNVEFYKTRSPDSVSNLTSFRIPAIRSNRNKDYREEPYVCYSSLCYFAGDKLEKSSLFSVLLLFCWRADNL